MCVKTTGQFRISVCIDDSIEWGIVFYCFCIFLGTKFLRIAARYSGECVV